MKTTIRLATIALALAATGAAFAGEIISIPRVAPSPTLTRAEITAQFIQARDAGQVRTSDYQLQLNYPAKSLRTRDEVRAETLAANLSGELNPVNTEYSDDAHIAPLVRHAGGNVKVSGLSR